MRPWRRRVLNIKIFYFKKNLKILAPKTYRQTSNQFLYHSNLLCFSSDVILKIARCEKKNHLRDFNYFLNNKLRTQQSLSSVKFKVDNNWDFWEIFRIKWILKKFHFLKTLQNAQDSVIFNNFSPFFIDFFVTEKLHTEKQGTKN